MATVDKRSWDEPARGYWRALGKFIHEFSGTERVFLQLLDFLAGVEFPISASIFFGFRADACKDAINRILEATDNAEVAARLKEPFQQFGIINGARNSIVHWGAHATEEDDIVAMNDFIAHTDRRIRSLSVSVKMLGNMCFDLTKINFHLWSEMEKVDEIFKLIGTTGVPDYYIQEPWRYKPPPQSPHEKARLKNRQVRRLLPKRV
jgi:hypothetical protein